MDSVFIEGLQIFAYHGVTEKERAQGRTFRFDVQLYFDMSEVTRTDELSETIDYVKASDVIEKAATSTQVHLLERLAQIVCDDLFDAFPQLKHARIRVSKTNPIPRHTTECAGVEIERERGVPI
ncbi:MAG TPA: dihydroneopterin aldolase [Fimbriimonadales bacterium]|nr:dihydroneopterin aldolase [Fimbriimonadales bacterium]